MATIHVKKGYQYLGWWLDSQLRLDEHTDKIARLLTGAAARVVNMGGRPGGLPVRTTFQLWSSLALSHMHGTAALLNRTQIDKLQRKMNRAVKQLAGWRAEPTAILAEMGIPNARTIHRIRLANLLVRLKTLPEHITPAALHGFLAARPTLKMTFEVEMRTVTKELQLMEIWQEVRAPVQSLARPQGEEKDLISCLRTHWGNKIKKQAWETHRKELIGGKAPYDTNKIKRYVDLTLRDLQRPHLSQCATYLTQELTANQEAALLQLRTGCSLLAIDGIEQQTALEPDVRCDACKLRNPSLQDSVIENVQHALLACCKRPHADVRTEWEYRMAQALEAAQLTTIRQDKRGGHSSQILWRRVSSADKTRLALGVAPPAEWVSTGADASRVIRELREEFIHISAEYLPGICKGLREYQLTVLQSLEAGDDTYQAVHSLWDEAVDFSEQDSEEEEEEGE